MQPANASAHQVRTHIRWMIRRDMPEILATEQASFSSAWTEEDFLRCLRQRNCIGMVAEHGERVVGYMIYELGKAHLGMLNFAVDPRHRRQGIGAHMVSKLVSKLTSHRRTRITLEVRETNLAAQLFFRAQCFRATKTLRGFYEDSGEDAFFMAYLLPGCTYEEEVASGAHEMDTPHHVNRITQYDDYNPYTPDTYEEESE